MPESSEILQKDMPNTLALDLGHFAYTRFNFILKIGDSVKIGQPIAEDKHLPGRFFVSPASGKIKAILRGEKRRPLKVEIEVSGEEYFLHEPCDYTKASKEEILKSMAQGGLLPHIRRRPSNTLASFKLPEAIFVKALESAPFMPDPALQLKGNEAFFQEGLDVLAKLTDKLHLVCHKTCAEEAFVNAQNVQKHTAEGPHPVANPSLHIYHICPLMNLNQCVWTLDVNDVITIGKLFKEGKYHNTRVITLGGEGFHKENRRYLRVYAGHPVQDLLGESLEGQRLISGDPFVGEKVEKDGYLGFSHYVLTSVKESQERQPLHFMGLGCGRFTATKTYLSGFFNRKKHTFQFTTHKHGEVRAFVDADVYQNVMPMRIPVMDLVKAVIAEDFEKAMELGLLEVSEDDFALPTFICPSKIEMTNIIRDGLQNFATQYISD
ncbi:MAG: Na(+)-translocating NADH-quinone reductase subunit A [Chlamydiia bacterium]|nr:Na(+)-translocating NADH-quinone reductase subunit A [Chlamydiia bacterium]